MSGQGKTPTHPDFIGSESEMERQPLGVVPAAAARPTVPDYDLLRRIGGGAYGEVWLARSKATGTFRAAKIVWRRTFEDDRPFRREFEGIQRFERISREQIAQARLHHRAQVSRRVMPKFHHLDGRSLK